MAHILYRCRPVWVDRKPAFLILVSRSDNIEPPFEKPDWLEEFTRDWSDYLEMPIGGRSKLVMEAP